MKTNSLFCCCAPACVFAGRSGFVLYPALWLLFGKRNSYFVVRIDHAFRDAGEEDGGVEEVTLLFV